MPEQDRPHDLHDDPHDGARDPHDGSGDDPHDDPHDDTPAGVPRGSRSEPLGRPRFLPPEEPAGEPADEQAGPSPGSLLPGLGEPHVRRRSVPSRQGWVTLIVAAGVAVALLIGGLLIFRHGNAPSIVSGASPGLPPGADHASLPDPCASVGTALPADVRSVKPRRLVDSCTWQFLRTDRSRSLDVDLQREGTDASRGTSGSVAAAKDFADDLAYTADSGRNGGFESDPERLSGLGDEAFAARASNTILSGPTERSARSYDMSGAQVEFRSRNIVVTVKWRGADYPASVRGRKKLVGTGIAYPAARRQAVIVAHALLDALA